MWTTGSATSENDHSTMTKTKSLSHEEQMEALRRDFAIAWLDQEIQLRRMNFTPRELHWAQRSAWLTFLAIWRKVNPS